MNNNSSSKILERNISYASSLFDSENKRGNIYKYKKVLQININNFGYKEDEEIYHTFRKTSLN